MIPRTFAARASSGLAFALAMLPSLAHADVPGGRGEGQPGVVALSALGLLFFLAARHFEPKPRSPKRASRA